MSRKKRSKNRRAKGRTALSVPDEGARPDYRSRYYWLVPVVLAVVFTGVGLWWAQRPIESPRITQLVEDKVVLPAPTYVGGTACSECHAEQDRLWRGSDHELAMQEANKNSVLGNFDNVTFRYAGITSTFFKRDDKFFVRTDGPDGKLADFEIKYTFGVTPLQQYLVEFPRGRFQALSIAWDTRPKEQGGQRWFHLYPKERVTHTDELHWTGPRQNWNFMCADCHSTNLKKNYDPTRREYHTTWSEIDVSCEACHGPGSRHVVWAKHEEGWKKIDTRSKGLVVSLDERKDVKWVHDPHSDTPKRNPPRDTETEIQVCAHCHSRRAQLFDDDQPGQPLMESYLPSLLVEGRYYADGQLDGEVYVYGSFLQSKMYKAGVTCSDCHDPHSLALKETGNRVCLQCHESEEYETAKHHFHRPGSAGANCVDCHMPARTYMVVDPRRDHSFRIPRPDLSVKIGTPNACNNCHDDKSAAWAAAKVRDWYGHAPEGYQQYAEALHAARAGAPDAESRLLTLLRDQEQPAIARATAAVALRDWLSPQTLDALANALNDTNPLVRMGALESLERLPLQPRWQLARHLLRDPVRTVRALAASTLADVPVERLTASERADFERASNEYLAAQRENADDAAAQVNVGNFDAAQGQMDAAERAYREALNLDPTWVPAYANLADLFRRQNRDPEGEQILRAGIARLPQAAALYHSLGLLQVREKDTQAALASLRKAAELAPEEARYSYVYAVALHSTGRTREALTVVDEALKRAPGNRTLNELRLQLKQSQR
jgi:predicted CXXCH cytochrome family protein